MKNDDEPDVVVFGEEVNDKKCKRDHHSVVWGTFVLFVGVVFLLNTLSLLPWSVWNNIWRFWPVLFILGGIQVILGSSFISRIIIAMVSILCTATVLLIILRYNAPNLYQLVPTNTASIINTISGYIHYEQ